MDNTREIAISAQRELLGSVIDAGLVGDQQAASALTASHETLVKAAEETALRADAIDELRRTIAEHGLAFAIDKYLTDGTETTETQEPGTETVDTTEPDIDQLVANADALIAEKRKRFRAEHSDIQAPRRIDPNRRRKIPTRRPDGELEHDVLPPRTPKHIPSRQPRKVHITPPETVDEDLKQYVDMPHMTSTDEAPIVRTEQVEIVRELEQEFVTAWLARARALSQKGHEEGKGRFRRFTAVAKDFIGYDRDGADEAVITAKAVEIDRVLQLASIMIENGQDITELAEKYPAVKDLRRYLKRMTYDAAPNANLTYFGQDNRVIGGNVDPTTNARVSLDGEAIDLINAMDAIDKEFARIITKYSSEKGALKEEVK